jgi:ribulose-5-phosphate 4-epimerase/fuculose-1-phosphate aldolase
MSAPSCIVIRLGSSRSASCAACDCGRSVTCALFSGAALARSLGDAAAVLMRGHGVTVVGETLRQTVFRAVYTELGAQLQAEAMRLGPVAYLSGAEAKAAAKTNDSQIDRAWSLWRAQARQNNDLLKGGLSVQN